MSKPIEQALSNLIPRHPGALPPELIDLASSLLAQSRMKASTLKAEEEIGRTYACANIACERLKTTLNLPAIEPRPPVPPRVYKNLYAYLDRSLISSTRRRIPTKATPKRALPQKQRGTPSKEASLSSFRSSKTGLKHASNSEKNERVPKWIGPVVRKLCQEMETPNAIPHILAGMETVLTQPRPKGGEKIEGRTPALLAAVWFFVMQEITGMEISGKEFALRNKKILDLFGEIRENKALVGKLGGDEKWLGWAEVKKRDVQDWISEILENDWLEMDWYANIGSGGAAPAYEDDEVEIVKVLQKRDGLGATMADQYDYLSEENRADYAKWKDMALQRIEELTKEGIMDVDP